MPTILERWRVSAEELTEVIDSNPSLRGFMIGYIGEFKLWRMLLADRRIAHVHKYDDHDRIHKNDVAVSYQGHEFTFEVKSLQTNSIKRLGEVYRGDFQCDASDRRPVRLPNGETVETTCLLVNGFDIVAVNLFAFGEQWDFAFALNRDLPKSKSNKYTPKQQRYLLATSVKITWPLQAPFVTDPFPLLDELVAAREKRRKKPKS
jgi:hypothetical protein